MSAGPMTTEELFREHASFVARFLVRLGVPHPQVEDALQEVFLVVHRNGGYRPGPAKPTSYLAGIAIHAASNHRRRERVERVRHADLPTEQMVSPDADPTRAVQAQEDLERLQLALDRLPDELRTTLVLIEIEGESSVSVAAALGWPVGTVYWRLHEARKRLVAALKMVDAERAHRRRVALQSAPPERRRAARASSLGIIMLFGKPAFDTSEAARLLRLAREQTIPPPTVEQLLSQHVRLVRAGAPVPSWAAGVTPHSATWFSLLGVGGTAGVVVAGAALLAGTMMWVRPVNHAEPVQAITRPEREKIAVAVQPTAKPAAPVVAATAAVKMPTAVPADRAEPAATSAQPVKTAVVEEAPVVKPSPVPARAQAPVRSAAEQLHQVQAKETQAQALQPKQPEQPQPEQRRPATGNELAEMRDIATAERLIGSDPARALAIVQSVRARFPDGYFREEHAYVEVMALLGLGRTAEGRAKADAFLRKYPDGPYSRRVQTAAARGAH